MKNHYDVVVIGSGAGGGTLSYALRKSGARILLLERGDFLPREPGNWSAEEVFQNNRYPRTPDRWHDFSGQPFPARSCNYVGGSTKLFGAALLRFREGDFRARTHEGGGSSPDWPFAYETLEPFYQAAEEVYRVHGDATGDPTAPPRRAGYPGPGVAHEPYVEELLGTFRAQGRMPFRLPLGMEQHPGGSCQRCGTCDGFPCQVLAKSDTEKCCVAPAIDSGNVTLLTRARATRLVTNASGTRVTSVEVEHDGEVSTFEADRFVVSCGVVDTPVLLFRSASAAHPNGLANSSGMLGRNVLGKAHTLLIGVHPTRRNDGIFHKTWGIHDFYHPREGARPAVGVIQSMGQLALPQLRGYGLSDPACKEILERGLCVLIFTESFPDPENRVTLSPSGEVTVSFRQNNLGWHLGLMEETKALLHGAGFPRVLHNRGGGLGEMSDRFLGAHLSGTARMGASPATSVVDPFCRAHDVDNLYVVDASIFPSQGSVNPALTIAANALRVGAHLEGKVETRRGDLR